MSPIEPDCSGVLDDGQFIYDGHATQPTIEGPKLYKRNGYYYIFAPAGREARLADRTAFENIYGPWEEKIVLHQGNSPVNGPHQGAWVDTRTDRTGSCISRMWAMQDVSFICSLCTGRMTGR